MYHINNTIVLRGASEENFRTKMFSQTSDSIKHKGITALFSVYKYREKRALPGNFQEWTLLFSRVINAVFPTLPLVYSFSFDASQ